MTDAQHSIPGQTSEFEFKLLEASPGTVPGSFPVSGKYRGWFMLKKPPPSNGYEKVEEKEINLVFEPDQEGSEDEFKVTGNGANRFGNYILEGKLEEDGSILLYRQYVITIRDGNAPVKKKSRSSTSKTQPTIYDSSPRAGSGRERKISTALLESLEEPALPKMQRMASNPRPDGKVGGDHSNPMRNMTPQQRAELQVSKCSELLRELTKLPPAFYFLEPVDPIKLNIPDYLTIIPNPMDLGTVRNNLDNNRYESPQQFADHMRLIFRNAITYNQRRDNVVHIAAREMSARFEDMFRIVMAQFAPPPGYGAPFGPPGYAPYPPPYGAPYAPYAPIPYAAPYVPPYPQYEPYPKPPRVSTGGSSRPKKAAARPAPHLAGFLAGGGGAVPPDGSHVAMQEMQRKMQEMQNEILQLRTTVGQDQIKASLDLKQLDAQKPLTYSEKADVVAGIHKLPPTDQAGVFDIIRAGNPAFGADDEVEIDVDQIDTHTLRNLQRYVESKRQGRKTGPPTPTASDSAPKAKKARTEAPAPTAIPSASSLGVWTSVPAAAPSYEDQVIYATNAIRDRGNSIGNDDFADFEAINTAASSTQEIRLANAHAWATTADTTNSNTTDVTRQSSSGAWGEAASEMQAKLDREKHQKAEVGEN